MTHNEKRFSAVREGQIALFTGTIYGAVHTVTGHPLDTIKSKMQLQTQHAKSSALKVARSIVQEFGLAGFFHGVVPPLLGSALYRGSMMSAYEFAFSWITLNRPADDPLKREYLGCIRPVVPISVVFASIIRGSIEAPFEYAKLMGQTEQKLEMKKVFRGFHWQIARTTFLLLPIFSAMDYLRRKTTVLTTLTGNAVVTFGVVCVAYGISWPLETMKNLAQSGLPQPGASVADRVRYMGGWGGMLRGIAPGATGGGIRNACGMVAMVYAQQFVTKMNWRGEEEKKL